MLAMFNYHRQKHQYKQYQYQYIEIHIRMWLKGFFKQNQKGITTSALINWFSNYVLVVIYCRWYIVHSISCVSHTKIILSVLEHFCYYILLVRRDWKGGRGGGGDMHIFCYLCFKIPRIFKKKLLSTTCHIYLKIVPTVLAIWGPLIIRSNQIGLILLPSHSLTKKLHIKHEIFLYSVWKELDDYSRWCPPPPPRVNLVADI